LIPEILVAEINQTFGDGDVISDRMKTLCALCALALLTGCQPKPDRYKVISENGIIIKVDTETGQSWRLRGGGMSGSEEYWEPIKQ
jgi:hypothetical protein